MENVKKNHGSSHGILLPKLFSPTVRKNCSSNQDDFLKFEAEGQEFAKFLRSLDQFTYSNSERSEQFLVTECFSNFSCKFLNPNNFFQFELF